MLNKYTIYNSFFIEEDESDSINKSLLIEKQNRTKVIGFLYENSNDFQKDFTKNESITHHVSKIIDTLVEEYLRFRQGERQIKIIDLDKDILKRFGIFFTIFIIVNIFYSSILVETLFLFQFIYLCFYTFTDFSLLRRNVYTLEQTSTILKVELSKYINQSWNERYLEYFEVFHLCEQTNISEKVLKKVDVYKLKKKLQIFFTLLTFMLKLEINCLVLKKNINEIELYKEIRNELLELSNDIHGMISDSGIGFYKGILV